MKKNWFIRILALAAALLMLSFAAVAEEEIAEVPAGYLPERGISIPFTAEDEAEGYGASFYMLNTAAFPVLPIIEVSWMDNEGLLTLFEKYEGVDFEANEDLFIEILIESFSYNHTLYQIALLDTVILNFEKEHTDNGIYKLGGEWFLPHRYFINPLGPWTGGIDVDCGCTNRKLGSDMGDGVTGGGLMGKDLSKADVSVNIVCYLKAVASGQTVTAMCSIGDESVTFVYADGRRETETFADIVEMARLYILTDCGGSFERFAEWGLLRPKAE